MNAIDIAANGKTHHVTINVRSNGRIASASCACGLTFGRGKTAERGAATHIEGWSATYETQYG